jgi:hypothetical protein
MTWQFQATISDVIHRVIGPDCESAWGVDHRGFDEDSPLSLGIAEVELPTGPRSLLLVPPSPGGLVLDTVRAYQGLTDAELCTLFLGIVSALRESAAAEDRLTLGAFALDAAGRPDLIPGVSTPLVTSPRRALGEMLYHAGYGRAWAECLIPVNLALADSSSALRSIVGELLADVAPHAGLDSSLAEVAEAMRTLARPAALPLVPADRDTDPEGALTARLRAAAGLPASRDLDADTKSNTGRGEDGTSGSRKTSASAAAAPDSAAEILREASRRPRNGNGPRKRGETRRWGESRKWAGRRGRQRRTTIPLTAGVRNRFGRIEECLSGLGEGLGRLRGARPGRWMVAAAVCLTILGGAIAWGSWSNSDPSSQKAAAEQPATDGTAADEENADGKGAGGTGAEGREADAVPGESEVVRVLEDLCAARAKALSEGDSAALQKLTVPDSAAAAADELIDESAFAGKDYSIEIDDITVTTSAAERIVARAQMTSHAEAGADQERFDTRGVEFELRFFDGDWRVERVNETGNE